MGAPGTRCDRGNVNGQQLRILYQISDMLADQNLPHSSAIKGQTGLKFATNDWELDSCYNHDTLSGSEKQISFYEYMPFSR